MSASNASVRTVAVDTLTLQQVGRSDDGYWFFRFGPDGDWQPLVSATVSIVGYDDEPCCPPPGWQSHLARFPRHAPRVAISDVVTAASDA